MRYFNAFFNKNLSVTDKDSIDIYAAQSGKEIFEFLAQPVPFCAYCDIAGRQHSLPWRTSERDISEWT